jgi:transcriptional regulator with XRE-family HTH domain
MARMIATDEFTAETIDAKRLTIGERFRDNVRQLMADRNLSQAALAERLTALGRPITDDAVRKLLSRNNSPALLWVELMARVFDVAESSLLK